MEKINSPKSFNYFVWTLIFNPGVVDIGGNLPLVLIKQAANLPPVSTTPVVLVAKFAADVFLVANCYRCC
jgi:hypothetical protein